MKAFTRRGKFTASVFLASSISRSPRLLRRGMTRHAVRMLFSKYAFDDWNPQFGEAGGNIELSQYYVFQE
jgi:hypothetical protein